MDKVADELSAFTKSIKQINSSQAQDMIKVLSIMVKALEKIGQEKPEEKRPTEWNLEVVSRDENGYIEKAKMVANG